MHNKNIYIYIHTSIYIYIYIYICFHVHEAPPAAGEEEHLGTLYIWGESKWGQQKYVCIYIYICLHLGCLLQYAYLLTSVVLGLSAAPFKLYPHWLCLQSGLGSDGNAYNALRGLRDLWRQAGHNAQPLDMRRTPEEGSRERNITRRRNNRLVSN